MESMLILRGYANERNIPIEPQHHDGKCQLGDRTVWY
jgi:hypothetical protein